MNIALRAGLKDRKDFSFTLKTINIRGSRHG